MIEIRLAKIAMTASLAFFALLTTFNNLVDYDSNYAFVQHVMSMDTTFPGNRLMNRAIADETAWRAAYALIIAGEALTGLVLAVGTVVLAKRLRSRAGTFDRGKRVMVVGAAIGFLVWFLGFMVIGGEWFAMWQSKTWNGQEAAFRFYMTILGVLIFVNQPENELG